MPAAVVSIEAPGANDAGVYHNAGGMDVSVLEAKTDALWAKLRELGVPSVAIGDLGNEIGMGKIADHIRSFVPFTAHGECSCGCKGGILAQSTADSIITATCSDWGCYGLMAALAYLLRNIDILHTEEMEAEVMRSRLPQRSDRYDGFAVARHRRLQPENERFHPQPDAPVYRLCASLLPSFRPLVRPGSGKALF